MDTRGEEGKGEEGNGEVIVMEGKVKGDGEEAGQGEKVGVRRLRGEGE